MKRICAWCNKFMGYIGGTDEGEGLTTHTICDECADNLDFQLGVSLQRYLDSLNFPIALVDSAGTVIIENIAANESASAEVKEPDTSWGGKIYECSHARLPERCDNTIHCSGCTIRFAATETYQTGREIDAMPALVNGCSSSPEQRCDYLISTRLVNGVVHLRIDKL